jgi:hypothetical protein
MDVACVQSHLLELSQEAAVEAYIFNSMVCVLWMLRKG